jgi:PAS domain S-box-containing protein
MGNQKPDHTIDLNGVALRQAAEKRLQARLYRQEPVAPADMMNMLHELQVHQIELEMQNEELKRVRDELAHAHEIYFDLYNLAPVGYFTITEVGLIQEVNMTGATLLGWTRAELLQQRMPRFIVSEDQDIYYQHRKALFGTQAPQACELRLQPKDGRLLWAHLVGALAREAAGGVLCRMTVTDITERKQAEERTKALQAQVERGARMESLGVLAGGVAHDLNNILGPLVAMPEIVEAYLQRCGNPADPDHALALKTLQVMSGAALRASGVVSDLMVMCRRGLYEKTLVDLNQMVDQLLASKQFQTLQARRPQVQIIRQLAAAQLLALGSESRLARVLANLLGNAVEAIAQAGVVTIRTDRRVLAAPYQGYECVPAGDYVLLEVSDSGCGMTPATISRIFEPFFTTKQPGERSGSGLGLSVVHGLVKDHAGFLDVQSTPGVGTAFSIYLPVATPVAAAPAPAPRPLGGKVRVLAVDDDEGQRFLVQQQLEKLGYTVTVVTNTQDAVAYFAAAAAAGQPAPVDLLLTDMSGEGLDGLEISQSVRKLYPALKIIVMSGHAPDDYETQMKTIGFSWLSKPYTRLTLSHAIQQALHGGAEG